MYGPDLRFEGVLAAIPNSVQRDQPFAAWLKAHSAASYAASD